MSFNKNVFKFGINTVEIEYDNNIVGYVFNLLGKQNHRILTIAAGRIIFFNYDSYQKLFNFSNNQKFPFNMILYNNNLEKPLTFCNCWVINIPDRWIINTFNNKKLIYLDNIELSCEKNNKG